MTATASPRDLAIELIVAEGAGVEGVSENAENAVDALLEVLEDPDTEMIDAGRMELERALPPGTTLAYRRELTVAIWRAMLGRVS